MSSLALKDFDLLSDSEKAEAMALLKRYETLEKQEGAQKDFMAFVKTQWPDFIEGRHHQIIAEKFNKIAEGKLKRLIVCLPPRHSKSEFASTFFPAWMMGRRPNLKIIQATHTAELAVRFGRRVRNIIDSDAYQEVFPNLQLEGDNKSAGRWTTNGGGEAFYSGVGGAITGRGADLLVIDDPVSEQDALSATALDGIYEWYTSGPRQRLQPGGIIVIVMTRWSTKDLVGRVLKKQGDDYADQWDVVEFPAIMPESEEPLWPEFWKKEELLSVKASLPISKWNAQWMQNPTAEEGSIVKREWWRRWEPDHVPAYSYVIQSYDLQQEGDRRLLGDHHLGDLPARERRPGADHPPRRQAHAGGLPGPEAHRHGGVPLLGAGLCPDRGQGLRHAPDPRAPAHGHPGDRVYAEPGAG
jgi:hypothetical protein